MSLANDLLAQASVVAKLDKKKPKQANLRRAVSTAYYALFHLLVTEASFNLSTRLNRSASLKLRRAFVHADMKKVCKSYASAAFAPQVAGMLSLPIAAQLQNLADVFVQLQEYRHQADYDISVSFNKAFVLLTIVLVEQALIDFNSIKTDANTRVFLTDLLLRGRWDRT